MVAIYGLLAVAAAEAIALTVLWRRLSHRDEELAELQRRLDTRPTWYRAGARP